MRGKDGLFMRPGEPFAFRYKDADDRWREKSTGTRDRKLAREAKRQFEKDLQDGQVPTDWSAMTVAAAAKRWLDSLPGHVGQNTIRSYRGNLTAVIQFFGSRTLKSIANASDVRTFQGQRRLAGKSLNTVKHEVERLACLLDQANLWQRMKSQIKIARGPKHSSRKPFSQQQVNQLIRTALSNESFWAVPLWTAIISANTSCRPVELRGLQLDHIHVDDGERQFIEIASSKTRTGKREIDLNPFAVVALRKLLDRARKLGACEPHHYLLPRDLSRHTKPGDPLYARRFGGFDPNLPQRGWSRSWQKLIEAAGLPKGSHFYALRNTALTDLAEAGVPLAVAKGIAGHMDEQMCEWYIEIRDRAKQKAVNAISNTNPGLADLLGLPREDDDKKPVN
jgi:integrase